MNRQVTVSTADMFYILIISSQFTVSLNLSKAGYRISAFSQQKQGKWILNNGESVHMGTHYADSLHSFSFLFYRERALVSLGRAYEGDSQRPLCPNALRGEHQRPGCGFALWALPCAYSQALELSCSKILTFRCWGKAGTKVISVSRIFGRRNHT